MELKTYKVELQWYGESHIFHTRGINERRAIKNAKYRLAQKLEKDLSFINHQLEGKNNRITVSMEKELSK